MKKSTAYRLCAALRHSALMCALLLILPTAKAAVQFSAIVPKEVTINTAALSGGTNNWAWLIATAQPITLAQIPGPSDRWSDGVTWTPLGGAGGSAPGEFTSRYNNENTWAGGSGLQPGQIAGDVIPFNDPFYSDLAGKAPDFMMSAIQAFVSFENGAPRPSGDYFLDAVIRLGNDASRLDLPYTTLVHFDAVNPTQVISAQLITAVPLPAAGGLLAFGLIGLRGLQGRSSRRK